MKSILLRFARVLLFIIALMFFMPFLKSYATQTYFSYFAVVIVLAVFGGYKIVASRESDFKLSIIDVLEVLIFATVYAAHQYVLDYVSKFAL